METESPDLNQRLGVGERLVSPRENRPWGQRKGQASKVLRKLLRMNLKGNQPNGLYIFSRDI